MYACEICERPLARQSDASNHAATHRSPVPCSVCQQPIKNIRAHHRRYHGVPFDEPTEAVLNDQDAAQETYHA